jgi:mannose-1-phosphate guanylyltransferase
MYYAVIMAGGTGTRLWPLSRQAHPKQALKFRLVGERTMFQHAVDRLLPVFPAEHIFVVTGVDFADLLTAQAPELPPGNFIIEPQGRGTAGAIGLAAIHLRQRDPEAVMAVVTADHFIADTAIFHRSLNSALSLAGEDWLVTLGIQPNAPVTGYGYIQQGALLGEFNGMPVFRVERFVEKPNRTRAEEMLAQGGFSWNSGMFIWKVSRIMEEFRVQMPVFHAQLQEISIELGTPGYTPALRRVWVQVHKQTIDYGVMEGARRVAVLPVEMGWTDIGSWRSVCELLPHDANGNSFTGAHIDVDTHDTLVFSEDKLVATIGVEGLVIVVTDDAVLICPKEREQDVRRVVQWLKDNDGQEWL